VAQETFFAKSIIVFCGETEILWDNLTTSAKLLQETGLAEALYRMLLDSTVTAISASHEAWHCIEKYQLNKFPRLLRTRRIYGNTWPTMMEHRY
jgi:hypothetical protein